tara:strand:+ start:1729 stop:1983 length:255 start_codon:yes stop_codon:yes gene_type:complete
MVFFLRNISLFTSMKKKIEHTSDNDVQDTLDKAGIERLWRGVSKTNVKDIEELKHANQLRKYLKGREKWLSNIGQNLKKKLLKS